MAETNRPARAKINLALHVIGQREDGYHLLDSLVVFADVSDHLTFRSAEVTSLSIAGPFGDGLSSDEDNLILKAANLLGNHGAEIHLEKNLPVASGIGGGSADAAAACHGLAEIWQKPLPDLKALTKMGADVPVCVEGIPTLMRGIGDILTPLSCFPDMFAVLVNPMKAVSTVEVFSRLKDKSNPEIERIPKTKLVFEDAIQFLADQRNDLQPAAIELVPEIGDCLRALTQSNARFAQMSGSGATCFGLFSSEQDADAATRTISNDHPDWWCVSTVLRG